MASLMIVVCLTWCKTLITFFNTFYYIYGYVLVYIGMFPKGYPYKHHIISETYMKSLSSVRIS